MKKAFTIHYLCLMKAGALQRYFIEKLINNFNEREIRNIFFQVLEEYFGIDRVHFFMDKDREFTEAELRKVRNVIKQLQTYKPLQYIFGKSDFNGLQLKVSPAVLIPRPETAELLDLISQRYSVSKNKKINILDIGTGSGCLAIGLAQVFANSRVWACDLMENALSLARQNASLNKVEIDFFRIDILTQDLPADLPKMDIIVSNPPYVTESEKNQMRPNVLMFEPHIALFVPDEDPLRFYKAIAEKSVSRLQKNAKLFLEINEAFGPEVVELLESHHFRNIMIWNDIHGKDRFVEAVAP